MGKRPAHCYTKIAGPANTRTKKYVRGVPGNKIVMYDMGAKGKEFPVSLDLIALERCQIRHMALEAARQAVNRRLSKLGRENYHFRIRVHPHHVLRENKMMAFAGADRMQNGMRQSFGKPADKAARVKKPNQPILTVNVEARHYEQAKYALEGAIAKLPSPARVVISKGKDLLPKGIQ